MTDELIVEKLKPVVKKRWLKALRSNKYQQGRGFLCKESPNSQDPSKLTCKFCCLGVLYDLEGKEWTRDKDTADHWVPSEKDYSIDEDLPARLADKIGLTQAMSEELMELNDDGEYTFKQIADYIEENY